MVEKLRILCSAMDSQGHVNAILGFAKILEQRGHHVIMTLAPGWGSLIKKHNFEFIPLQLDSLKNEETKDPEPEKVDGENVSNGANQTNGTKADETKTEDPVEKKDEKKSEPPNQKLIEIINSQLKKYRLTPMEAIRDPIDDSDTWLSWYDRQFPFDDALQQVMDTVKPDMIVLDFMMRLPCLEKTIIPWAQLWSCNPIMLYKDHCPPATTGFPTDSPRELWNEYMMLRDAKMKRIYEHVNSWLISRGVRPYRLGELIPVAASSFVNFYTYPSYLDYNDIAPRPAKWVRMDASVREPDDSTPFVLPEQLVGKPGSLIYFSLGSMGSVDLELMRRIISVLAKSPHRFIVSKGPCHEQIELPDNMWGEGYVNQIAILPHVDLVITHGGNNTLTESLYFGKPTIVMPIFFDQLDNAQRAHEKGIGIRIDTYRFEDSELLDAIEKLLKDESMKEKLLPISESLKSSNSKETVCELIEKTVASGRSQLEDNGECKSNN